MFIDIRKKVFWVALSAVVMVSLNGCSSSSSEKELAAFSQSISSFTDYMSSLDDKMSEIDLSEDSASKEILSCLDDIDNAFSKLANMNIPDQYASIAPLAKEASENMSQAVSLYHAALEADSFDEDDASIAFQYYSRAMTRISYIGTILQGELPEGDNITVYETNVSNEIIDKIAE